MTIEVFGRAQKINETMKRWVACPKCGAKKGHPCKGSRIPSPNSFGGGWGGPPNLDRAHPERRQAYLQQMGEFPITQPPQPIHDPKMNRRGM